MTSVINFTASTTRNLKISGGPRNKAVMNPLCSFSSTADSADPDSCRCIGLVSVLVSVPSDVVAEEDSSSVLPSSIIFKLYSFCLGRVSVGATNDNDGEDDVGDLRNKGDVERGLWHCLREE